MVAFYEDVLYGTPEIYIMETRHWGACSVLYAVHRAGDGVLNLISTRQSDDCEGICCIRDIIKYLFEHNLPQPPTPLIVTPLWPHIPLEPHSLHNHPHPITIHTPQPPTSFQPHTTQNHASPDGSAVWGVVVSTRWWLLVDHCVLRNWGRILVRAVKGLISRAGMVSICPLLWQRDVKLQQTNHPKPHSFQDYNTPKPPTPTQLPTHINHTYPPITHIPSNHTYFSTTHTWRQYILHKWIDWNKMTQIHEKH